ncbi:MAG: prenyltransferase [Thaumarchaeota archaeon]|nr:prenyltransferase [Nitrososphaerota archaeon]
MQNETAPQKPGNLSIFFRLTRVQFLPLIILPAILGTSIAYRLNHVFNPLYFIMVLVGVILLHLGANAIDDCYDYQNGVDKIANDFFPKDFGGWKPIARGMISLRRAKLVSYFLFLGSLLFAIYFSLAVGIWSLIFGVSGIILAIFYTAPPLKLDYLGYGLGELSILLAFGPIPVLGAFYIQTGHLSFIEFLVSIAVGLVTVTILIDHDLIFYEVYSKARKFSLGTVLGRANALKSSLVFTIVAYSVIVSLVGARQLPVASLTAPLISGLVLARKASAFRRSSDPPPYYVSFTVNALFSDWLFALVLAITIAVSPF